MPQHDFTQLKALYPQVLHKMPAEFTSHQFIRALTQQNQQLYVEALHAYRNNQPFQTVHRELAKMLNDFPSLVKHIEEVASENIWQESSRCAKWRKGVEKDDHQALEAVQSTWATIPLDRQTLRWVAEDKELEYGLG